MQQLRRRAVVLLAFESGPLRNAIERRLQSLGLKTVASASSDDWFERAAGSSCVVYAPAANLLQGTLQPQPDPERVRRLLGAANAAGVRTAVVVVPRGPSYGSEIRVLRAEGMPYVVVQSAFLVEEVASTLDGDRQLWIPRLGRIAVTNARAIGDTVEMAVELEPHGRTLEAEAIEMDLVSLFQRAAYARATHTAGAPVRVHGVPPVVYDLVRPIMRGIRGKEPQSLALADQLSGADAVRDRE
jgi:hypothetical protein